MRRPLLVALLAGALLLGGCALPQRKDVTDLRKTASTLSSAIAIVNAYNAARGQADALLDASILAEVEAGAPLAIDRGRYLVARHSDPAGVVRTPQLGAPVLLASPRFGAYPMWFVMAMPNGTSTGDARSADTAKVAVFRRSTSVAPWRLVSGPDIAAGTELPRVTTDATGAARSVSPRDAAGLGTSAQRAVEAYATVLADPPAPQAAEFVADDFIRQMRDLQDAQNALAFADFEQMWTARPVRFALRTVDGGALVFATLVRTDRYTVARRGFIDWKGNAAAQAYLPGRVLHFAQLRYLHQILMVIPPAGQGRPRVIGQSGGVVDGSGS